MTRATPPGALAPPQVIRIVIADDHAIVRDGLRSLIEAEPGLTVVGEAADGDEAWRHACALAPDVLLLDLSMPRVSGTDAAERIARECPTVRVLALTAHEERGYVARLLRAGAAGYLVKRAAGAELVRAIRLVAAGGTYVDPSLAGALLAEAPRPVPALDAAPDASGGAGTELLTGREAEVLRLAARGLLNKEIAHALAIGVKTVETHKSNGMARLGVTSRAALVRFALAQGWLADD